MQPEGLATSGRRADVRRIRDAGGKATGAAIDPRDSRLLFVAGMLVVPLAITGFLGLTVLLLPLLALRWIFPRRATPFVLRRGHEASPDFGVGDFWDTTRRTST